MRTTKERRAFLKETAAAATLALSGPAFAKASANEQVRIAVIGVRGRGRGLATGFAGLKESVVTHICDVDRSQIAAAVKGVAERQKTEPKAETDLRRLIDDKSIDAVAIATPDHWHAPATIWACQAGKHVYVEKPASHNVWEGRKMVEAARKHDRVVQLGTQSRSAPGYLEMIETLRAGKIGKVHMAKAWNSQLRRDIGRKADSGVPDGVDYDLWLGPAPARPFNVNRFHSTWHWNWDYGTGDMGNDGVHDLDIARWGLGARSPSVVAGMGTKLFFQDDQEIPDTQIITFTFPETKQVLVFEQRIWSPYVQEGNENGVAFYGTEGYIIAGRAGWRLIMRDNKEEKVPTRKFSDVPHFVNFLECVKSSGKRPNADIEEGHLSSTLAHLGNIVARTGRQLTWDGATETIRGDTEAGALLRRSYRKPFELSGAV